MSRSNNARAASELLNSTQSGDEDAARELFVRIYEELRGIATVRLNGDADRGMLRPTALVHEAYLKLIGAAELDWNSMTHFRAIAARAMQQVVTDQLKSDGRVKRGRGWDRVTLHDVEARAPVPAERLDSALTELARVDDRAATVVSLRFFGGLTEREIAAHLGLTDRTVRNDWRMARAWLQVRLDRSRDRDD